MAQSQNTVREIFVVDALASESTLKTFEASASDGEIGIFQADGSDGTSSSEDFVIAMKSDGGIIVSDRYNSSQIKRAVAMDYVAPILRLYTVAPTNTTAGTEYVLDIRIQNFGSLSAENFYDKYGQYIVVAADTQEDIVDGLISSLNKNFSREIGATASSNPYFSFNKGFSQGVLTVDTAPDTNGNATVTINGVAYTVALLAADDDAAAATKIAAVIDGEAEYSSSAVGADVTITSVGEANTLFSVSFAGGATNAVATYVGTAANAVLGIEEKDQAQDLGKDEGRPIAFDVRVDKVSGASIATVVEAKGGNPGRGTGKQVALMEYFYRGNRGDGLRQQHFPYNWNLDTKSKAVVTEQYGLIEMTAIRLQDEEFNVVSSRKEVTIAVPVSGGYTAINAIINQLEQVITQTIADLS